MEASPVEIFKIHEYLCPRVTVCFLHLVNFISVCFRRGKKNFFSLRSCFGLYLSVITSCQHSDLFFFGYLLVTRNSWRGKFHNYSDGFMHTCACRTTNIVWQVKYAFCSYVICIIVIRFLTNSDAASVRMGFILQADHIGWCFWCNTTKNTLVLRVVVN